MGHRGPVFEKANGWIKFCEIVMYPLTLLLGRRRFSGLEHLAVPGPVLVVSNHISQLDPIYTAVFLRKSGRIPHIMAKASLFRIPLIGKVLTGTGQIPVVRGGGHGQVGLEAAIDSLKAGRMVLIYPDGTVTRDPDRWPMKPRPGVAAMALTGDFPVVPMVHWGTQDVYAPYTKGGFHPLPRKDVRLVAGPPIDLSAYRGLPINARLIRDVSYVIQSGVRDLLGEVRGVTPPVDFYDQKKAARLQARADAETPESAEAVAPATADGSPVPSTADTATEGTSADPPTEPDR